MTQLVVDAHARRAQRRSRQPRAVQRVGTAVEVGGFFHDTRQRPSEGSNPFGRQQRDDRIAVLRVQRLNAVRDRVHPGRTRDVRRESHRQRGVVQHRFRQHLTITTRSLETAFGQPINRGHFRAGIGGRHGYDRQRGFQRDRLGQADRGTTADRHTAIGLETPGHRERIASRLDRNVHDRLGVHARERAAQSSRCLFGVPLPRRRQNERAPRAETLDLPAKTVEGAVAEDDSGRWVLVHERFHGRGPLYHKPLIAAGEWGKMRPQTRSKCLEWQGSHAPPGSVSADDGAGSD